MSRHELHQDNQHGLMELIGVLCNGTIDCDQLSLLERRLLKRTGKRGQVHFAGTARRVLRTKCT